MRRFLAALVFAMVTSPATGQQDLCDYRGPGSHWIIAEENGGGYEVRVENPARAREVLSHWPDSKKLAALNLLPRGERAYEATEFLAREGGATILYAFPAPWGVATATPIPLDGVWRGAHALACLRSFAQAAGLEVVVPQPGLWLIGPAELVRQAALVVFAYRIDATLQPLENEASVRELELAFLERLPIRQFLPPFQRHDKTWDLSPALIGLGYDAVPGEPDTYLVVATQGTFTEAIYGPEELTVTAAKVRVHRDAGKLAVECLWARGAAGPLVPEIQEDIDGDGIQDFYFRRADLDGESSDLIVSGADGATITTAIGGTLAVEKDGTGPKRFSVARPGVESPKAQVYRFDMQSKHLEVVRQRIAGSAAAVLPGSRTRPLEWPADALAAEIGSMDKVKVYCLPGFRAPHTPGMDFTQLHGSPVWGWFLNKNPREAIEQIPANLPIHVLFKYLSPGYLEARVKEKQQQSKHQ